MAALATHYPGGQEASNLPPSCFRETLTPPPMTPHHSRPLIRPKLLFQLFPPPPQDKMSTTPKTFSFFLFLHGLSFCPR